MNMHLYDYVDTYINTYKYIQAAPVKGLQGLNSDIIDAIKLVEGDGDFHIDKGMIYIYLFMHYIYILIYTDVWDFFATRSIVFLANV